MPRGVQVQVLSAAPTAQNKAPASYLAGALFYNHPIRGGGCTDTADVIVFNHLTSTPQGRGAHHPRKRGKNVFGPGDAGFLGRSSTHAWKKLQLGYSPNPSWRLLIPENESDPKLLPNDELEP